MNLRKHNAVPATRGAGSGGQGAIAPLSFNILKTRGHRGADCAF